MPEAFGNGVQNAFSLSDNLRANAIAWQKYDFCLHDSVVDHRPVKTGSESVKEEGSAEDDFDGGNKKALTESLPVLQCAMVAVETKKYALLSV
ncbi:MAG: hypothetical protein Fues2KO_40310 [Fuerstiella sp.]